MSDGNASAMLSALEQQHGSPLRAMIEVSDRCNEVCVHCYQEQGKKGEMSTAELKRVLDELSDMGVLLLTISGGEATLRPDLLEILEHAHERGFCVKLFTNGLTMTRQLAQALFDRAVQTVEISLYSQRPEVHEFVTGVPGSFARTVAGIRHLAEAGVHVHVKTPVMTVNEHEIDAYAAFVAELGATLGLDHGVIRPREGGDREPERLTRSQERFEDLSARFGRGGPIRVPAPKPLSSHLCGAGESIHVEPNGELRPCALLEVDLGHALAEGVRKARASHPRYAELAALRWSDVRGCRECDLRAYCSRCHATSLAEVGDALAPYPSACADARSRFRRAHGRDFELGAEPGVDPRLGPYRAREPFAYEAFRAAARPEDDALAARLGWTRRADGPGVTPDARIRPGSLVQLRRPGRKRPATETVPGVETSATKIRNAGSQLDSFFKPIGGDSAPNTGAT